MKRVLVEWGIVAGLLALAVSNIGAQIVYHLHQEVSSGAILQLKVAGPDSAAATLLSADFKNRNPFSAASHQFTTDVGVPGEAGTIAAGSTVSFSIWMRKTTSWGTFFPRAWFYLNSTSNLLCQATGGSALTTTLTKYDMNCTTGGELSVTPTDRWLVGVGVNMTAGPGNKTVQVEIRVEGVLNGNYDSKVTAPPVIPFPPRVTGLTPTMGPVGTILTVSGQNLSAQAFSTLTKINDVSFSSTTITATSVTAPVPATATTGPVTITVGGQVSNSLVFTVTSSGAISGTITRTSDGTPLSGVLVEVLQGGVVVTSSTSSPVGAYGTPTLQSASYAVRATAVGYVPELVTGVTVGGGSTTVVNVGLAAPGSVAGIITASGGGPIPGAAVNASQAGTVLVSTTADSNGSYSLSMKPGTYSIEASAPQFAPAAQSGVAVVSGASATANLSLVGSTPSTVQYLYDELGRLIAVVDATGDTAVYEYDAAGNILSISRTNSSVVSVLEFSPSGGPGGSALTISGTGFSSTPSENIVTIGGVPATVSTATPTELQVVVPIGAITGVISVTSPAGTASSSASFVVGAGSGPTITGFTPSIATHGTSVTVNGTNFQTSPSHNAVTLGLLPAPVTTASPSVLTFAVPTGGRSGRVVVATPYGVATSGTHLFVAPAAYLATDVAATASLVPFAPITIETPPSKISLVAFDGTAGQRIRIIITNNTPSCAFSFWIYDTDMDPYVRLTAPFFQPDVVSGSHSGPGSSGTDLRVLPETGSYQLLIDGCETATNSVTVTLQTVPPDVIGQVVPGGPPATITTTVTGQNALFRFAGIQNQRVALILQSALGFVGKLIGPNQAGTPTELKTTGTFMDTTVLAQTAPYEIFVDPNTGGGGNITATLYHVPDDVVTAIVPGGSTITAANTAIGQNVQIYFEGTAGRRSTLQASGCTFSPQNILRIYGPTGTLITEQGWVGPSQLLESFGAWEMSGIHRIEMNPTSTGVGSCNLALSDFTDIGVNITPDGTPLTAAITVPTQNAGLYFDGVAGERVFVQMTNVTFAGCAAQVQFYTPPGTLQKSDSCVQSNDYFDTFALGVSGTQAIILNPTGTSTGSVTFRLYSVPADLSGTLTINGATVGAVITTPGQVGRWTFSANAGTQATVHLTNNAIGSIIVTLLRPDGTTLTTLTSSAASFNLPTQTLPTMGTYTVVIDPVGAGAGAVSVNVTQP